MPKDTELVLNVDYVEVKSPEQLLSWLNALYECRREDKRYKESYEHLTDEQVLIDGIELDCFNQKGELRVSKMVYRNNDYVFVENGTLEDDAFTDAEFLDYQKTYGPKYIKVNDNYLRARSLNIKKEMANFLGEEQSNLIDVTFCSTWACGTMLETKGKLDASTAKVVHIDAHNEPLDNMGKPMYESVKIEDGTCREFRVVKDKSLNSYFLALPSVINGGMLDFSDYPEGDLVISPPSLSAPEMG